LRFARRALMIRVISSWFRLLIMYATTSILPITLLPRRNRRGSMKECLKSSPSIPSGSTNAVNASSNDTRACAHSPWPCGDPNRTSIMYIQNYGETQYFLHAGRGRKGTFEISISFLGPQLVALKSSSRGIKTPDHRYPSLVICWMSHETPYADRRGAHDVKANSRFFERIITQYSGPTPIPFA
jgi:hypothetical protein